MRSCLIDIPEGSTIKAIWVSPNLRESDLLTNTDINIEVWERKFSGEDKLLCQELTVPGTGRCKDLASKKSSKNSFVVDIYDQVITNNSDLWKYYFSQVRAIKVEYEDQ